MIYAIIQCTFFFNVTSTYCIFEYVLFFPVFTMCSCGDACTTNNGLGFYIPDTLWMEMNFQPLSHLLLASAPGSHYPRLHTRSSQHFRGRFQQELHLPERPIDSSPPLTVSPMVCTTSIHDRYRFGVSSAITGHSSRLHFLLKSFLRLWL